MNFRLILNIMGYTLWVEAGCLLLPLLVSVGYGEACWEPFLWTLGLCSLCGLILTHIPARKNRLQGRDGYAVVAMAWVVLCLFGAVPYVLSGAVPHYADALFETASGLTTTGATILTDVEAMPRGILFWRALTQWMGGMGVLVLFLALMPWTGAGGVHLMRAESPGPIKSKLLPHVNDTAKVLYGIYIGLTTAEIVALCLAGMDLYDAVVHSFATISTGGFSTRNASIAAFGSPAITWIVAIFMFLSGINFSLIFISLRGHIREALHSEELRLYTLLTLGSIGLIAASLMVQQSVPLGRALKDSVFNAVSTVTTTGFATADFAVKHEFDTLGSAVGFILSDRELDVQMQSAVGGRCVILLFRRDPHDVVRVQDALNLVIVCNVAKPSVQLDKQDDVDIAGFHVAEHAHELRTVPVFFTSGDALVRVQADDGKAVFFRVGRERFTLRLQ